MERETAKGDRPGGSVRACRVRKAVTIVVSSEWHAKAPPRSVILPFHPFGPHDRRQPPLFPWVFRPPSLISRRQRRRTCPASLLNHRPDTFGFSAHVRRHRFSLPAEDWTFPRANSGVNCERVNLTASLPPRTARSWGTLLDR